jgi:hypothetical protein
MSYVKTVVQCKLGFWADRTVPDNLFILCKYRVLTGTKQLSYANIMSYYYID